MTLNRPAAIGLLGLAVAVVLAACGTEPATVEEKWASLDVPEPEIVFLGDFTDEERAAITRELKSVQVSHHERFGVVTSEFTLYISTEFEAASAAYREWLPEDLRRRGVELPEWFTCDGFAHAGAVFIVVESCDAEFRAQGGPIAHYYFHILQSDLGLVSRAAPRSPGLVWPTWLINGSAVYASAHHAEAQGRRTVLWRRAGARVAWSSMHSPAARLNWSGGKREGWSGEFPPLYGRIPPDQVYDFVHEVGFLAVEWLVERRGEEALMDFFRLGGGRQDFEKAFDMTPDEFVEAFEEHRQKVAPPYEGRFRGTVVDPNGKPVAYPWVSALVRVKDMSVPSAGARANSTGAFDLRTPGSGFTLRIFLLCPRQSGWVFIGDVGKDGFVADEDGRWDEDDEGAEPFAEDDRIRPPIIQLPETPEALVGRHCR